MKVPYKQLFSFMWYILNEGNTVINVFLHSEPLHQKKAPKM